jgi:hypothetical protein
MIELARTLNVSHHPQNGRVERAEAMASECRERALAHRNAYARLAAMHAKHNTGTAQRTPYSGEEFMRENSR